MDPSIVDTAMTSRKRKREEYKKIILLVFACVVHMVIGVVTWYPNNYFVKKSARNWELERHSFLNPLYRGTHKDCIEKLRLSKNVFFNLCRILQENGGLVRTRNVPTIEAVEMFLHILAHNLKYRVVQFSYCRSKEIISRQFNDVLRVRLFEFSMLYFRRCGSKQVEMRCIGALDETHIPITVSPDERPRYRNRKGDVSTNVLVAYGPDLRFIYVLPGWEGSQEILEYYEMHYVVKTNLKFQLYFLVDAGYTNGLGFLAPYQGTRYHLNEWIGNTPQSYKELFNLRHASAQNAIERSFGILKKRWSILRTPSFFDIKTQIRIINACFVLHNFIRDEQQTDQLLEVQDLEFLSIVDEELVHQSREGVQNNVINISQLFKLQRNGQDFEIH
ncbi:Protein ALP1-like [Glycine max]|nr:Protein ALP1-like [Glycine max]